jgi:hypothetical protein
VKPPKRGGTIRSRRTPNARTAARDAPPLVPRPRRNRPVGFDRHVEHGHCAGAVVHSDSSRAPQPLSALYNSLAGLARGRGALLFVDLSSASVRECAARRIYASCLFARPQLTSTSLSLSAQTAPRRRDLHLRPRGDEISTSAEREGARQSTDEGNAFAPSLFLYMLLLLNCFSVPFRSIHCLSMQ